jgi:hypothetical protein
MCVGNVVELLIHVEPTGLNALQQLRVILDDHFHTAMGAGLDDHLTAMRVELDDHLLAAMGAGPTCFH